jgi:hypothetical protein
VTADLTIAVLTVNRPSAVRHCLYRVFDSVEMDFECIVIDSTQEDALKTDYDDWDVGVVRPGWMASPAGAQKLAVDACSTKYLLPLADDMAPAPGTVERLYEHVAVGEADIATGVTVDPDGARPVGRFYYKAEIGLKKTMGKLPIRSSHPVRVHEGETLCAAACAFEDVSFDPEYAFHYDMWDFYLSCLREGLVVLADPDATFEHSNWDYAAPTLRDMEDKAEAASRFFDKWGWWPKPVVDGLPDEFSIVEPGDLE